MRKAKIFVMGFVVFSLAPIMIASTVRAEKKYKITYEQVQKHKKFFDDPRPVLKELSPKKMLPPEIYAKLIFDVGAMKRLWAEVIGFRAPDVVGKIAPEIKPGTYTYRDKEKYPGLKELMIPTENDRFNPGAPPFAGNFPEITVVPTRQYYWALPVAEATKKHEGRSKLNDQGILSPETYAAGYPFPKPSGKFKGSQIVYNWLKRYTNFESGYGISKGIGFAKTLREDRALLTPMWMYRLHGRVIMEPYGWFDKRAQENGEDKGFVVKYLTPRDYFGNVAAASMFLDPDKFQQILFYINVLRRVRLLSGSDLQEPAGMGDLIFADGDLYSQNLSSTIYPYRIEVVAEREYLIPAYSLDGSGYYASSGAEMRNYEFERRPMYVVKMSQLDKNFVYSTRLLYIDKETFMLYLIENFDQKGRLYRSASQTLSFFPEMGMFARYDQLYKDHLDLHSSLMRDVFLPAPWLGRKVMDLRGLTRRGK